MTDISNNPVGPTAYQLALHVDFSVFKKEVADIVDELCEQYLNLDRLKILKHYLYKDKYKKEKEVF